jgi:predicted DCC family thiol-disulfide oxidoreductase YuxK
MDDANVNRWVIFYDGECGMCASSVNWIRDRDRAGSIFFASLQGHTATVLPPALRQPIALDTLVVAGLAANGSPVKLLTHSDAIIFICRYLGGLWSFVGRCFDLIPRRLRDYLYSLLAQRRHHFSVPKACRFMSESEQERFLP